VVVASPSGIAVNPDDLQRLPIDDVAKRCAERDDDACFELFRRALACRDDRAWERLLNQYWRLVGYWVGRHTMRTGCAEEDDDLILTAFKRLWNGITAENFPNFGHVGQLKLFLKKCALCAVMDCARRPSIPIWDGDEPQGDRPHDLGALNGQPAGFSAFWDCIKPRLNHEQEFWVCVGTFIYDLRPRDIHAEWPDKFASVKDVSRVKDNLLERFRRDPALRECLEAAGI